MNATRTTLALAVVLSLTAVSCSDGGPSSQAGAAAVEPSPTPDPTCPLTGEKARPRMNLDRPAVALKIENSPQARPQSGLESADLVYEEVVEGGITRFMAIFHCGSVAQAGPVRSARFDDPKIAKPFTTLLAYSGGNAIVEAELAERGLVTVDEDTPGEALYRVPEGVFELHNLFADIPRLRRLAQRADVDAPPSLKFGDLQQGARRARSVSLNFLATNTIEYRWSGNAWQRFEASAPFMTAGGEQLEVTNLIVQEVTVNDSTTIRDVAGNPSPDIDLYSSGKALLFRDGKVVRGRWKTDDKGEATTFTTRKTGEDFVLAPGNTWIELVPSPAGSVKGSFSFTK
ncbi:MAG: DUF3048 domain-containing protein [Actinomycetota bacterium]